MQFALAAAEGRRVVRRPMFPGYLFLRHALDKGSYLDVAKSPGFVAVLGERWDRPAEVPESEVEALRAVSASGVICMPHPFLRSGARVRIIGGSLAGVEGVLLRRRDERGLLVVSVEILRRSVSLEIDCTAVVPI